MADDVDRFIKNAEDCWLKIDEGNSKDSNKIIRENDKLIKFLEKNNEAIDFLVPLLSHDSSAVRYAASAYLLNYDEKTEAIKELKRLCKSAEGLIGAAAAAALRIHKIPLDE